MSLRRASTLTGKPPTQPRDGKGRPLIVPRQGGKPRAVTRTTTFIDMEDKTGLSNWRITLLLKHLAAADPDGKYLSRVESVMGKPGEWNALLAIAEEIHDAAGGNDKARRGDRFHEMTEYIDRGEPIPDTYDPAEVALMGEYLLKTLDLEMREAERFCVNEEFNTGGTPDRTIYYAGPGPIKLEDGTQERIEGLFIGDLKTGNLDYLKVKTSMQMRDYADSWWYDFTVFDPVDTDDKDAVARWKKIAYDEETAAKAYKPVGARNDWGILLLFDVEQGCLDLHWLDLEAGYEALLAAQERQRVLARPNRYIRPWVTSVTGNQAASEVASE